MDAFTGTVTVADEVICVVTAAALIYRRYEGVIAFGGVHVGRTVAGGRIVFFLDDDRSLFFGLFGGSLFLNYYRGMLFFILFDFLFFSFLDLFLLGDHVVVDGFVVARDFGRSLFDGLDLVFCGRSYRSLTSVPVFP